MFQNFDPPKYQDLILPLWGAQKTAQTYEYETLSSRWDIDVRQLITSMVVLKWAF